VPYTADAHSGYFSPISRPSQSFTPFHLDHAAAVGWAVFDFHQPFFGARNAPTPDASTIQRARTVLEPSPFLSVIVCSLPGDSWTSITLAGRKRSAPARQARRSTSSSNVARSS